MFAGKPPDPGRRDGAQAAGLADRQSLIAFLYSSPFLPLFCLLQADILSCCVLGSAAAAGRSRCSASG